MPAVEVFGLCDIAGIGGMGMFWTGIDLPVIETAMRLVRIPRDDRREVAEDVRYMGQVVAASRNKRAEEAHNKQAGTRR